MDSVGRGALKVGVNVLSLLSLRGELSCSLHNSHYLRIIATTHSNVMANTPEPSLGKHPCAPSLGGAAMDVSRGEEL